MCKILSQEFDDISISKIRYLEDQKLLSPRRTPGGYRLYSQADVERLRTILRMQRDEFLPLRVIRQELAAGGDDGVAARAPRRGRIAARSRVDAPSARFTAEELIEQTGAPEQLLGELEEFGIVQPTRRDGESIYDETDLEIVRAAAELAPLRRRRAQPARLPDLGRPRGGAAAAAHRPGAALAQPGSPQGGDREPREPGRGVHPPPAPAAGPGPAPPGGVALVPTRAARCRDTA